MVLKSEISKMIRVNSVQDLKIWIGILEKDSHGLLLAVQTSPCVIVLKEIYSRQKGSVCFFTERATMYYALGVLNSVIVNKILLILCPTLDFHEGPIGRIPLVVDDAYKDTVVALVEQNTDVAKCDWDCRETSYGFTAHPIVPLTKEKSEQQSSQLASSRMEKYGRISWHFEKWTQECESRFNLLKANEEELNRIFIEIYGLQDELTPEVEDKGCHGPKG